MVRKSILVYDLLRTAQPEEGFSEKEIVEQISNKHDILPGKGLRRQVTVALRRGLDFGIIAKKNNRFRFEPDGGKAGVHKQEASLRRAQTRKRKAAKKTTKARQRSNANTRSKNRKRNRPVPQPKMPKTWTPNRRNLIDEPVSKVKKI